MASVNYRVLGAKFPQLNAELEHLIIEFNKFDVDSEGAIDQSEVMTVARGLKQFSMDQIQMALPAIPRNGEGKITFDDYLQAIAKLKDVRAAAVSASPARRFGAASTTTPTGSTASIPAATAVPSAATAVPSAATAVPSAAAGHQQQQHIIKGEQQNTTHAINQEEIASFVHHINAALKGDKHLADRLPIAPEGMDVFDACRDGILLAKLINHSVPDTIDERALNLTRLNVYKITENQLVVINSAKAIGCQVTNIGAQDLIDGVHYLTLGLLWQIIKVGLLSKIDIKLHPELYRLLEPGETLEQFIQLPADQILMRWVNYHLKKAQCPVSMSNFSSDLKDSVIYTYLLHALQPAHCSLGPLRIPDLYARAEATLQGTTRMNVPTYATPKSVVEGNQKLNLATIASIFNHYPGLEALTETERAGLDSALFSSEGDRESRAFALWLNSLGVDLFVQNLFTDLQDGLVLLQAMDKVSPGIVDWRKVNKAPVTSRFKRVENCNYAVVLGKSLKFSLVGIQGLDIVDGARTLTLALVWQLMRTHMLVTLQAASASAGKTLGEEDLIAWANATVLKGAATAKGRGTPINGFRDQAVRSGIFFVDVMNGMRPGTVDFSLVTDGANEEDARMNCKYAISMARKLGASIFVLPEDIIEGRQRLLLTFIGSLMMLDV
ncbi:calponin homology domain-containing protein [Blastocladiella britannica]|nr:calponin homology domain-containing protein [Blastocladiella britannica]